LWNKLISITTDGSPNLKGKNQGFFKRVQDSFHDRKTLSIIHQEVFCKTVPNMNHVTCRVLQKKDLHVNELYMAIQALKTKQFFVFKTN
jgi:hypothetical protein